MADEEFIREYTNGGHIPGIPGFFPAGVKIRVDERTNTVVPDELPPALPEQPLQNEQASSENVGQQSQETVTHDTNQPEQGVALPVEGTASRESNPLIDALGKLGGN